MLSSNMEDYLEAIEIATLKKPRKGQKTGARVSDIRRLMGVKMPSVSGALAHLRSLGLVEQEPYGQVFLTKKGLVRAREVKKKHSTVASFLHTIVGVDKGRAEIEACKIEHAISRSTLKKITAFLKKH